MLAAKQKERRMAAAIPITVYSDVICPWCYVGKRRLETALGSPGVPEQVPLAWRPFELNPDMPAEGMERQAYRAHKFGAERSAALDRDMAEIGREVDRRHAAFAHQALDVVPIAERGAQFFENFRHELPRRGGGLRPSKISG